MKPYDASSVIVSAVENGYLITVHMSGSTVSLVALDQAAMLTLLTDITFRPPAYGGLGSGVGLSMGGQNSALGTPP